jgi:hypothetical protein
MFKGKDRITLLGVGDIVIDREKPESISQHTPSTLREADIAYGNCDQTFISPGFHSGA